MKSQLLKQLPNAEEIFGYITKAIRLQLGLEKSHAIAFFIIAQATTQARAKTKLYLFKRKTIDNYNGIVRATNLRSGDNVIPCRQIILSNSKERCIV